MKQHPHIIGLTGFAGTGKDTVRGILKEHGYNGLAFADPIRAMLRELLTNAGISEQYMDSRNLKEEVIPALGVSYRHLAQSLGTEWGRSLQHDFWLRIAGAHMADLTEQANAESLPFVLSDVRFVNEAAWIRARGGVIWQVSREGINPVRLHVSEAEIERIQIDRIIFNDWSIDDLRTNVQNALEGK